MHKGIAILSFALAVSAAGWSQTAGPTGVSTPVAPPAPARPHIKLTPDEKAVHQAVKLLNGAAKGLNEALPVYDGLRVDAFKNAQTAVRELRIGLKGEMAISHPELANAAPVTPAPKKVGPKLGKGGAKHPKIADDTPSADAKTKFTPDQLTQSQAKVQQAITDLTTAQSKLAGVTGDFDGHKAAAITAIKTALTKAQGALALFATQRP